MKKVSVKSSEGKQEADKSKRLYRWVMSCMQAMHDWAGQDRTDSSSMQTYGPHVWHDDMSHDSHPVHVFVRVLGHQEGNDENGFHGSPLEALVLQMTTNNENNYLKHMNMI
jgi:hypothetical protein